MLIFLLTLTKKVSILTSFSLLKKVSALSSKLTKKVSFEVRGVHSPQLGQWSASRYTNCIHGHFLKTEIRLVRINQLHHHYVSQIPRDDDIFFPSVMLIDILAVVDLNSFPV